MDDETLRARAALLAERVRGQGDAALALNAYRQGGCDMLATLRDAVDELLPSISAGETIPLGEWVAFFDQRLAEWYPDLTPTA